MSFKPPPFPSKSKAVKFFYSTLTGFDRNCGSLMLSVRLILRETHRSCGFS